MHLYWTRDLKYEDCWELHSDTGYLGFVMGADKASPLVWYSYKVNVESCEFPDLTVDEAKVSVEAMIRLEG